MRRTLPWAALALCPLGVLVLATSDPGISEFFSRYAQTSPFALFMLKYWWSLVLFAMLLHAICFAALAITNQALTVQRRVLWSLAMVVGLPIVVPIYWWLHSESCVAGPPA